jgi:hypothetical protein
VEAATAFAPRQAIYAQPAPLASRGTATPWAIFLLVVDLWWRAFRQYRRAYGGKRRGLAWFIVVGGRGGFSGLHKLRYRMPGLGAEVLRRLGAIAVTLPGGEIVGRLCRRSNPAPSTPANGPIRGSIWQRACTRWPAITTCTRWPAITNTLGSMSRAPAPRSASTRVCGKASMPATGESWRPWPRANTRAPWRSSTTRLPQQPQTRLIDCIPVDSHGLPSDLMSCGPSPRHSTFCSAKPSLRKAPSLSVSASQASLNVNGKPIRPTEKLAFFDNHLTLFVS